MEFKSFVSGSVCALALVVGISNLPSTDALSATALQQGIPSLAPMLREVTPAVVSIKVSKDVNVDRRFFFNEQLPDELRRYFNFDEDLPRPGNDAQPQRQGSGSGVIIDAREGLIVTNHHVVNNANQIDIILKDGRSFAAEMLGSDAGTDIALLQIDASDLIGLEFADSDTAEIGDFVVAIGNPFGIGQTVTSGIIGALGRAGLDNDKYEDFIQTDAAINVGNSGGALVDMEGNLVGINTAIISSNGGGSDGIGFAVPANMVAAVVEHLERDGEVRRGMLGVQISNITREIARSLELNTNRGALVTNVLPDSAAEAAGVRLYDVIVEIDGNPVFSGRDLRNYVGLARQGQTVALGLLRAGDEIQLTAAIGAVAAVTAIDRDRPRPRGSFAGARLRTVDPDATSASAGGVEIIEIASRSRAWQAGLREGDIITEVNREAATNLQQFNQLVDDAESLLAFTILRNDRRMLIFIR